MVGARVGLSGGARECLGQTRGDSRRGRGRVVDVRGNPPGRDIRGIRGWRRSGRWCTDTLIAAGAPREQAFVEVDFGRLDHLVLLG